MYFIIYNHEYNKSYVSGKNIDELVRFLEESSRIIFKWFSYNQFQANSSKCHLLLSTDQHVQVNIGAAQIENSSNEKLLDVAIDAKLSFEEHIEQIYVKSKGKNFSKNCSFHEHPEKESTHKNII